MAAPAVGRFGLDKVVGNVALSNNLVRPRLLLRRSWTLICLQVPWLLHLRSIVM